MHNRRFCAFLMGGWLIGTVFVWFAVSHTSSAVDRILEAIPPHVQKEFPAAGQEIARQVLQFEASESNRRVTEIWETLQLGIAGALLACSALTSSRSKTMILCSLLMMTVASVAALYITPTMNSLSRAFDFLPATAALREREQFQSLNVWHRVLGVLNAMAALVITVRLLFDFYEFGARMIPGLHRHKHRRRHPGTGRASGVSTAETGP